MPATMTTFFGYKSFSEFFWNPPQLTWNSVNWGVEQYVNGIELLADRILGLFNLKSVAPHRKDLLENVLFFLSTLIIMY